MSFHIQEVSQISTTEMATNPVKDLDFLVINVNKCIQKIHEIRG